MVMAEGEVVRVGDLLFDAEMGEGTSGGGPGTILSYKEAKAAFEREFLRNLLTVTGGNVSEAARLSGRLRSDLYTMMKRHGISRAQFV